MLHATILLCSAALTGPCDRHTATDIIQVPGVSNALPTHCLQQAEAYLAQAPGIDVGGSVVRIVCERRQRMEVRK
jgi:hypothetical protein